jgi:hypothetical protein
MRSVIPFPCEKKHREEDGGKETPKVVSPCFYAVPMGFWCGDCARVEPIKTGRQKKFSKK